MTPPLWPRISFMRLIQLFLRRTLPLTALKTSPKQYKAIGIDFSTRSRYSHSNKKGDLHEIHHNSHTHVTLRMLGNTDDSTLELRNEEKPR